MKTRFVTAAATAGVFALLSTTHAGVLVPLPKVPGSDNTYAIAINNNNVIAGRYVTADGLNHGFFGTLDGNYTTFDAPGTSYRLRHKRRWLYFGRVSAKQ